MWAELEAVREFGTTPMWRLSIYGLDASEPQVSVSIPVPDHAALLRWQVSRDGVFDTSLPLDLWQTGALSGTVNPTGRGRLDILLQAKLDPKQVALGTVIELEATVGSWTDSWPVEYQVDPFTRDEKLWPKNDHRAVEEFLHVDKQGGELLADLVARGWTLADLLRSVIDVQDRILAAGIMAVQGPQGEQGDTGADGADGVVDYDEAWDRANHTGTQSADTLTDGTTKKAFLATERTDLSSAVTKLGSVDNTGALFRIVNATGTGSIPLIVKGMASQTGDLQQWQNSAGTSVARIAQDGGAVFVGSLYTIAAQATSGTGAYLAINGTNISVINRTTVSAVPLIVKGMAAQTGNLQEWQNSAGTVLTRIMAGGSIDTGQVIYAPAIYDTSSTGPTLALGATSVTITNRTDVNNVPFVVKGMAGQVESLIQGRTSAGTPVFKVASNGSIYSAVSLATPVVESSSYNGSYLAVNGTSALVIGRTTVSNPVLVVRGMASQTGNLQEWQDSANAVKAYIAANGTLVTTGSVYTAFLSDTGATGPYIATGASSLQVLNRNTITNVPLIVKGMAGQTGALQQWQDSAGTALAWVSSTGGIATNGGLVATTLGSASSGYPYLSLGTGSVTVLNRTTASNVPLVVKGMAAQSGALQQWQDSAGVVLAQVSSSGSFYLPVVQAAAGTGPYAGLDGSSVTIYNRTTASNVPLVVRGMASQAGNLQQWQDSTGTVLTRIAGNGSVQAPFLEATGGTEAYVQMANSVLVINRNTVTNVPLVVRGMASQTGNLQEWQDSAGVVKAFVSSVGGIAATGGFIGPYLVNATNTETYLALTGGSVLLQNRNTVTNKPLIVQGMASQTGNLTEWQDSAGTVLASVSSTGMWSGPRPMELMVSVTDETTALTTGTAKLTFRIPRACAVTSVRANLNTVSSSGNPAFDVNKNGTSIFSTTLTIDASEKTSVTAATAAVLTSNPITFADDDEVTIDIDTAGTGAKGAKLTFLGYYT